MDGLMTIVWKGARPQNFSAGYCYNHKFSRKMRLSIETEQHKYYGSRGKTLDNTWRAVSAGLDYFQDLPVLHAHASLRFE